MRLHIMQVREGYISRNGLVGSFYTGVETFLSISLHDAYRGMYAIDIGKLGKE